MEKLIYEDELQSDNLSDGDIIGLQMLALTGLQEERNELIERIDQLQSERTSLLALNQRQTDKRLEFLNEFIRQRGLDLRAHGTYLIEMSESEDNLK